MFKIKQKTKKIISVTAITSLLFIEMFPLGVSALTIPDSLASSLLNGSSTTISNVVNSKNNDPSGLSNKQQGPKVDVTFNGSSQQGSKMTATAVPSFFNNASDPKNLYFTWYLKRLGCDKTKTISSENRSCDLDGNGEIDENDWKIAAARIIIKGSFDRSGADYSKVDENLSGYKAVPSPIGEWSINSGDSSNNVNAPNCYIQEPKSGLIYEVRRVLPIYNACPNDAVGNTYHQACVSDQQASCSVLNPNYNSSAVPTNQTAIDQAITDGVTPPTPIYSPIDANIKTIQNNFPACAEISNSKDDVSCKITDLENFKTKIECKTGETSLCVKDDNYTKFPINGTTPSASTNPLLGIIFGKDVIGSSDTVVNNNMCSYLANPNNNVAPNNAPPNFLSNSTTLFGANELKCSTIKDKLINGTKDSAGNVVLAGSSNFEPTCGFEKSVNMCKHLFPKVPKNNVSIDGKTIDMNGAVTGDGKFTAAEKQFWGGDPTSAATNGTNKDEEAVVGLGVDTFSWMFSPGDQVGVVVEGDSAFPTGHSDSSFKRMWAFSNNVCKKLEEIDKSSNILDGGSNENKRGFYIEGDGSINNGFLTAEFDLNDCLEENLLDPDASSTANLSVQLNAMPENPINDPNGRGDILSVVSSATNTQNSSGLLYKWSVQKSRDGSAAPIDTTSWADITSAMQTSGSFTAEDIQGTRKKDLAVNLNMPESLISSGMTTGSYNGVFYLRIKLRITGTAADGSQNAEGQIVVRVRQQGNEMLVYSATANDAGMLNLNKGLAGQSLELCSDKQGKQLCYVAKNDIVGLEIPETAGNKLSNFSWTVNGNAVTCSTAISSECSVAGNKMFVPIIGNEGEAVDVVAKALNEKNESIEVSRHFVIGKTQLQITSSDPNSFCGQQCLSGSSVCPKYLGFYKDLNGGQYPDCSTQVWETNTGKTVTLNATGQTGFDWAIDGQIIPDYKDQNQIQIYIDKSAGESYNIGLSSHLLAGNTKQLNNMRMALYRNWGVAPEDVVEENQSANIQLDVVGGYGQAISAKTPSSFGASLITHLPEQAMFLLKISLTSILLLMVTGLLFAFIPETLFKEER